MNILQNEITKLFYQSSAAAFLFATGLGSVRHFHPRRSNWTIGQTVVTTSGSVAGHIASNQSAVSEYLGTSYAQAPAGTLRFAPTVYRKVLG